MCVFSDVLLCVLSAVHKRVLFSATPVGHFLCV